MNCISRPLTDDEINKIRLITGIQIKKNEYAMFLILGEPYKETKKGLTWLEAGEVFGELNKKEIQKGETQDAP